ncbi:MAG: aminotransferase class I/II-fold pyridoxal phosphate-dependent enzyme [Bacilli bacterium]|nr:aminotransferase class I/II-fold pyridoxal phosphate-dependent enzyme [Bacilli bacterium]
MFINKNSIDKKLKNNILALSSEAMKAKKEDPEVINATVGMLKDENGVLYEFACVEEAMKSLNVSEKYAYSNSAGSPLFSKAIYYSLFGKYLDEIQKDCYLECIPTPGGSGALNLAFTNYTAKEEIVLLPNHMWENYLNISKEVGFIADTYRLFDDEDCFDINDLNSKINEIKNKQNRIMILINDPCENPTGFCMKDEDYDALLNIAVNNPRNSFIYLVDVAYFDFYNVNPDIIRSRYAKFKNLPSNALALFVYSGSKSFGLYGLRIGALLALSKDENEIISFREVSNFSCRTKWSSASTLGISIIQKLVLHEEYRDSYEEEVKYVCAMLEKRSIAFLESAKKVGLQTLPYERGFFICVPCKNPEKTMHVLHKNKVYLIPTHNCLRIALCGINKEEASRLPSIIKQVLDSLE